MNDFTKEELQDIDYALETVYLGNSKLRKKIQALIETYCEHEINQSKTLQVIQDWLAFSLLNQLEIQKECELYGTPAWNEGYLEALRELEEIIHVNTESS